MRIAAFALAAASALAASDARADAVVTLCQSAQQAGAGINLAQAVATGGLVTFNCGAATIQVTSTIAVERNTVIDGNRQITLVGGSQTLFETRRENGTFELKNLTISNVRASIVRTSATTAVKIFGTQVLGSDAPLNVINGSLDIQTSVFQGNTGQVVSTLGNLTIDQSRFENNIGIAAFSGGPDTVTRVTQSTFANNSGGALLVGLGNATALSNTLEIKESTFEGNGRRPEDAIGGGLGAVLLRCNDMAPTCTVTIKSSKFTGNAAQAGAALSITGANAVLIRRTDFIGNTARGEGGAIFIWEKHRFGSSLVLQHTFLQDNRGTRGGAVYADVSSLKGHANIFAKNQASDEGGGLSTRAVSEITRGIFVDNRAANRGGALALRQCNTGFQVENFGGCGQIPSHMANTIIARNSAGVGAFSGTNVELTNVTVADNQATGIVAEGEGFQGGFVGILLKNTIVSNNAGENCRGSPVGREHFRDTGNNLEFPVASCASTIPVANPHLDTLYLPVPGSPALSRGNTPACMAFPVSARDVYGKKRPYGEDCSIGAAEGELEKEVAEITVGAATWPGGLDKSDKPKVPIVRQGGDDGRGDPNNAAGKDTITPSCCCFWQCPKTKP